MSPGCETRPSGRQAGIFGPVDLGISRCMLCCKLNLDPVCPSIIKSLGIWYAVGSGEFQEACMAKKVAAVLGGVLLGLIIAFARAGAFPFWGSDDKGAKAAASAPQAAASMLPAPSPAAPNAPEPNEKAGVIASFAPLVKHVLPTVVSVQVVQDIKASAFGFGPPQGDDPGEEGTPPPGVDPFEQFRRFFGQIPREYKQRGLGSGVIISPDGYILTNNHVVGAADEIKVQLHDKREFTAKVIGKDQKTDLALIKISTKDSLPSASLGDSDRTEIGDWVVAIGNPFNVGMSVSAGIVRSKG